MHIEGRLQINLFPADEQVNRVSIQSSRPLRAAKIFEGKTPQEVMMQLPLLFSVCGVAQATAGIQAFQQAMGLAATVSVEAARTLLIQMETAREHLWRILMDWPGLLNEPGDPRQLVQLQPMLLAFRKALFGNGDAFSLQAELRVNYGALHEQIDRMEEMLTSLVFCCPTSQWLRICNMDELDVWTHRAESVAARLLQQVSIDGWQGIGAAASWFLPELSEVDLNRRLEAPDASQFIAEPMWTDTTRETTPLARQYDSELIKSIYREYGNGVLTRLAARLVELARIPEAMRTLAGQLVSARPMDVSTALPAGIGIGQVEAARGRLIHRVVLNDSNVHCYQILAPTEWNFHPEGIVTKGLKSLPNMGEATLRNQAALLINAVDPCVGYDLQVH